MIHYLGLDFEASGTHPWQHVPIQIGLSLGVEGTWSSLIGGWDWREHPWEQEAFEVHQIEQEILKTAPPVHVVDVLASAWLIEKIGWRNRMFTITVGYNVAGYDRQFVTRFMPNLNRFLSYRTVDLNAALFLLAGTSESAYVGRKKWLQREAAQNLGLWDDEAKIIIGHHDAGVDADLAVEAWRILRNRWSVPDEHGETKVKGPEALI